MACGRPQLTAEQAADLVSKSPLLSGVENLELVTAKGCFTMDSDAEVSAADVERDPYLNELEDVQDALDRALELGLVEFEFTRAPAGAGTPPKGCDEQLWRSHSSGRSSARQLTLVAWKAVPTDKAIAAGLQQGQTFLYRRQVLGEVTRLIRPDDRTTVVEYSWHWAPTYQGQRLGISASPPVHAKATFTLSDLGWRLAK